VNDKTCFNEEATVDFAFCLDILPLRNVGKPSAGIFSAVPLSNKWAGIALERSSTQWRWRHYFWQPCF